MQTGRLSQHDGVVDLREIAASVIATTFDWRARAAGCDTARPVTTSKTAVVMSAELRIVNRQYGTVKEAEPDRRRRRRKAAHVTGGRSAPTSAEIVMNYAAPARNSVVRRHDQLGGAGAGTAAGGIVSALGTGLEGADASVVIAGPWRT